MRTQSRSNLAETLFKHEAFSDRDLEWFGQVVVDTDALRSVLDAASRVSETIDDIDASIAVGKILFILDELIDYLYTRPDVMSVCWRAVQNQYGSVPGWLIRAKRFDEGERLTEATALGHQEPDTQAKERLALVQKLLRATTPKCIRVFRNIPLPKEGSSPPGMPLVPQLEAKDAKFELELLSGPEAGSITLEFTSRDQAFANVLFGYVLAPGPDGNEIAGFAAMANTEDGLYVADALVPAGDVDRLAGCCNGVTAGPVDLDGLAEADWLLILATARTEIAASRAPGWRAWATALASRSDVPELLRLELRDLVNSNT